MSKQLALQQSEWENRRFHLPGLNLELDNFMNWDKSTIKTAVQFAAASILDGECDAIDALIFVKKGSELFKELDAKIRPIAESKPIDKDYSKFGVKITEGMQGVKYDLSHCGCPIYDRLLQKFEAAKNELDERAALLKTVTKPTEMYDPETSEVFVCKPPVKSGKLGFTLTVK